MKISFASLANISGTVVLKLCLEKSASLTSLHIFNLQNF